jgi:predicted nucleic-acid-binding Zn-ribbon protein
VDLSPLALGGLEVRNPIICKGENAMMKTCPECGSTEIVSDLIVFTDQELGGQLPAYVQVTEPKPEKASFLWLPKTEESGFRAAVCGGCGYTRFYATKHAELLQARMQGFVPRGNGISRLKV